MACDDASFCTSIVAAPETTIVSVASGGIRSLPSGSGIDEWKLGCAGADAGKRACSA